MTIFRSLTRLEAFDPDGYLRMIESADGLTANLTIDGERSAIRFGPTRAEVADGHDDGPDLSIVTDRPTIGDVLDGSSTLAEAARAGLLQVIGPLDRVVAAHDALLMYVAAAVQEPGHRDLVDSFNTATLRRRERERS